MTAEPDQSAPLDVEQAVRNMDQAMHDPGRRSDAMGDLFTALGAAAQQMADQRRRARELLKQARRNDPIARANRARGARQGWEKRRAREERERLLASIGDGPVRIGPVCGEMNHNSVGSEVSCELEPGHDEDHDDDCGTTWEREA